MTLLSPESFLMQHIIVDRLRNLSQFLPKLAPHKSILVLRPSSMLVYTFYP